MSVGQRLLERVDTAVAHLQWYPWTNYHGLESSFTLTLKDDGCAAAMAPGSGTWGVSDGQRGNNSHHSC